MKRKREIVENKTEIHSAIDELSLLINIIHSSKRNYINNIINNNNNDDNINKTQPQSATSVVVVVAVASTGVAETTIADHVQQQIHQQQKQQIHQQQEQQQLQQPQQQQQFVCVDINIPTKPFLSVCTLIIQILDKIGPTMAVMRQDIYNNIQRLEMLCDSDPTTYSNLVEILKKEAVERSAKKGDSCSKAVLWLTRALDFTAAMLRKLVAEPRESMEQIVAISYDTTLKPWHGWISAIASKVALKLVPERDAFISLLTHKDENMDNFRDEVQAFISLLESLLEDLHSTLNSYCLEKLKST